MECKALGPSAGRLPLFEWVLLLVSVSARETLRTRRRPNFHMRESDSLLPPSPMFGNSGPFSGRGAWREFMPFAVLFSVNHGTVTSTLSLASSLIDSSNAGLSNGLLYLLYASTSLLLAVPVLRQLGVKRTLILAMALFAMYVGAFLLAMIEAVELPAALIGGVLGGIAAGLLWTAQGAYLTHSSSLHATRLNCSKPEATSRLSGAFATVLLSLELAFKLLSSVLLGVLDQDQGDGSSTAKVVMLVIFSASAMASAVLAPCFISDVEKAATTECTSEAAASAAAEDAESKGKPEGLAPTAATEVDTAGLRTHIMSTIGATVRLCIEQPKILLLAPFNMAFGLQTALVAQTMNDVLATQGLGTLSVGILSSVSVGVAALLAAPISAFRDRKVTVMNSASVCFVLENILFGIYLHFDVPGQYHNHWQGWLLMLLPYALQGVGRAAYESVNKALTADIFAKDSEAAFANILLQSGFSSALFFFVLPSLPWGVSLCLTSLASMLSLPCLLLLMYIVRHESHDHE